VVLHQVPGPAPLIGVAFVVAAGIGAERTGAREHLGAGTGARERRGTAEAPCATTD
jgi:inner membrane transporter RhtA